jgi:hypothetical protein
MNKFDAVVKIWIPSKLKIHPKLFEMSNYLRQMHEKLIKIKLHDSSSNSSLQSYYVRPFF